MFRVFAIGAVLAAVGIAITITGQVETASKLQNVAQPSLMLNQKNEVSTAIRALRKMVSITETGVNQREYASRLLDMTTTVDETIHNIPESQLKTNILLSKRAYVDANNFWSDLIRNHPYLNILLKFHMQKLKEYEIDINYLNGLSLDTRKLTQDANYSAGTRHILSYVWTKGHKYVEDADALLQGGRLNP